MKGIVNIVVKDKNNNVKYDVNKCNTITDAFKNVMQNYVNGFDKYLGHDPSMKGTCSILQPTQDYFNGIFVNDKVLTDDLDVPYPVLRGGQNTLGSGVVNARYSVASTHNVTSNKITNVWSWTAPSAFTMKSMALHDRLNTEAASCLKVSGSTVPYYYSLCQVLTTNGDKRFITGYNSSSGSTTNYSQSHFGTLKVNMKYMSKNVQDVVTIGTSYPAINPLYNDEWIVSTDTNGAITYYANKLSIYDKADINDFKNATPKRTFNLSQFKEATTNSSYNSSYSIIPTPENDYMVLVYSKHVIVWVIPREGTTEEIPYIFKQDINTENEYCKILYGRYLLLSKGTSTTEWLLLDYINNQPSIKIVEENLVSNTPAFDKDKYGILYMKLLTKSQVINPYIYEDEIPCHNGTGEPYPITAYFPIWHNHTILNLDTPVDIVEGDTLTITYTITAE